MMHIAAPKTTENIKLSDSLQLQLQEDESVTITTAIEYYFAIRTLCNAWGWAGNFEATDHDGSKKLFINLSDAQSYADFCLCMNFEVGQGSLQWMSRNDMLTRSRMASLIRRNYTAWSALKEALHQANLEWRSAALQNSGSLPKPRAKQPPPEPENLPPTKRVHQVKSDNRQTVSMLKGGCKICKAFNDQRGGKGECNNLHVCDMRLSNGQACQSTSHNRQDHPE